MILEEQTGIGQHWMISAVQRTFSDLPQAKKAFNEVVTDLHCPLRRPYQTLFVRWGGCTGVSQEQTRWTAKWYVLNVWTSNLACSFPACRWASGPKSKIWCQVSNSPCFLEKFSTIVLNWKHFAFILLHRKLLQILGNRKYKKYTCYIKYIYYIYVYIYYTSSTNHMVVFQANYASWLSFL